MNPRRKPQLPRIAGRVHDALKRGARFDGYPTSIEQLLEQFPDIARTYKRLRMCRVRGWRSTELRERSVLARRLRFLEAATNRLATDLAVDTTEVPSYRSVLEDLLQIEEDLGTVRFDRDDDCLCVVTEPITLEGVFLGSFEMRICLGYLAAGDASNALCVVALDPHPCAADDAITHPHVNDGRVCLGDATKTLEAALQSGRLADAFQIVGAVLRTYNDGSPYCALNTWNGRPCEDCGYVVTEDRVFFCEHCDRSFCDECFDGCRLCGDSSCVGCLCTCELCDERVCEDCLSCCAGCGESGCTSCLEEELCPSCLENEEDENNDDEEIENNEDIETSETDRHTVFVGFACSAAGTEDTKEEDAEARDSTREVVLAS